MHLDPRAVDVVVPDWLKRQPQLVLQIGLNMPVPIRDLRIDDAGVFGTLSFNRAPFTCMVPWHAVFALVGDDGRGMVWPDSMPPEIAQEVEREAERVARGAALDGAKPRPSEPAAKRARKARPLRPVEPVADVERAEPDQAASEATRPAGLRLIPGHAREAASTALSPSRRARRAPHLRLVKS